MRSIIGMRAIIRHDGQEQTGMISSIRGTDINITLAPGENIVAPLDDVEIIRASQEQVKQGIELIVEW